MWKKWHADILLVSLLLIIAFLSWRQMLGQVIRSDGFVYMLADTQQEFLSRRYFYTGFENAAIFLGIFLPKLFGTSMYLYFAFSLTYMLLIDVLFYIFARVLFKKRLFAFSATLIFALNYFGNFDMYSQHCYCFFIERITPVPFLLTAFLLLHVFLEKRKKRFLLFSLLSYFVGIGIGHFSLLFTGPYVLYPFFWHAFRKGAVKSLWKGFSVGAAYGVISVFFVLIQRIHEPGFGPKLGLFAYFMNPTQTHYPLKIIRQLTHWSQYPPIFHNLTYLYPINLLDRASAEQLDPYIVVLYVIIMVVIWKALPTLRALLATTVLGTLSVFYLNAWFGQYDVFYQPGASRYLYFPNILLSLFWMLFLVAIFTRWKTYGKALAGMVLLVYCAINIYLIYSDFKQITFWDLSTKSLYSYVVQTRRNLVAGTLIVVPRPEFWTQEEEFFTTHLGKGEVRYISENNGVEKWEDVASSSAHVVKLSYDTSCECVKEEKIK